MADPVEALTDALAAYWSSPLTLSIVAVVAASMVTLLYVFLTNARNAKLRVSLLSAFYALTVFFWLFVALSLAACIMKSNMVAYETRGVQTAAAGALLLALALTTVITLVVWRVGSSRVLKRFAPRPLGPEHAWIQKYADLVAEFEGMPHVPVGLVDGEAPLAMAVGGPRPTVLLSRGLLGLLEREELETSLAHELMHLKHHDAGFKIFSIVFSRILFFDPFSKLFDPAVHREREYLADEASGRASGKPAALASALLKIAGREAPPKAAWGLSIHGTGHGMFSRYPPVEERVHRLLLLSDLLEDAPSKREEG